MTTETIAVIGLIAAIYGAFLSTILAIREYLKNRPKIKLHYKLVGEKADSFTIYVENMGERPVSIVDVGALTDQGKEYRPSLIMIQDELPCTLEYGQVYKWKAPTFNFRADGITVAYARTAAGKMYTIKLPPKPLETPPPAPNTS